MNPERICYGCFSEKEPGTVCPARLINEGRWDEFCAAVKQKYTEFQAADAEN